MSDPLPVTRVEFDALDKTVKEQAARIVALETLAKTVEALTLRGAAPAPAGRKWGSR